MSCNRRLFYGLPGFNIFSDEPRILYLKCPKCGSINIIYSEVKGEVVVRLKEMKYEYAYSTN